MPGRPPPAETFGGAHRRRFCRAQIWFDCFGARTPTCWNTAPGERTGTSTPCPACHCLLRQLTASLSCDLTDPSNIDVQFIRARWCAVRTLLETEPPGSILSFLPQSEPGVTIAAQVLLTFQALGPLVSVALPRHLRTVVLSPRPNHGCFWYTVPRSCSAKCN